MTTQRHDDRQLQDGMHYTCPHLIGVLRTADEAERSANPLARAEQLSVYWSDQGETRQAALDALSQWHAIVPVYASCMAQEDQAESILRAHEARELTYIGRWSITDLRR